jgi:CPA2 family monovalent cation:H+ antiporter-2
LTGDILFQAVIYLTAAIICVPIAKRLGLSSVLGFLIAGIIIGPFLLGFIGEEGEDIMHFAEFGVVMMLFLIGLEIEPSAFWRMRKSIIGLGGLQVGITLLLVFTGVIFIFDLSWQVALTVGMAFALSSTAIVLQTLKEKGLMDTSYGQSSFSVLLFQDIAVIPMLALLPLLSTATVVSDNHGDDHGHSSILDSLPIGLQTAAVLLSVAIVVFAGRYLFVPVLRQVAKTRLRELFTACALLIVLAITFLMNQVGLSPALGAFLGGVVLANSEFKHELESNLEPFKGLLLGLFFMAVGASINFDVIANAPLLIGGLVLGAMLLKILVLMGVGSIFSIGLDQKLLFSVGLSQIGEFSFVLLSFAFQLQILNQELLDILLVITAISMTISPILNIVNERLILPRIGTKETVAQPADAIEMRNKVIIAGFGHFGSTAGRFLRANGVKATILDHDSDRVELLRKMGFEVYYGDATRLELLESAGANEAEIFISAIDNPKVNFELTETLQKHFPHLKIMIRAKSRIDAYDLLNKDVQYIYRETLDTSVKMAGDVLAMLGKRKYNIHRQSLNFIKYDEQALRRLAQQSLNSEDYISKAREEISLQESLLKEDNYLPTEVEEESPWDNQQMIQDAKSRKKSTD